MEVKLLILCYIHLIIGAKVKKISEEEKTIDFWKKNGNEDLLKRLEEEQKKGRAKNIILFIGDGMGPSTLAAARIYKNQRMVNSTLPDVNLVFDMLTNTGLVKTHSVDDYVADSSSTATAILTGVKIRSQVVGAGPNVFFNICSSYNADRDNLESIGSLFSKQNRSVGIVTTTRITHATPASLYAHSASRNWEAGVPANCSADDIALQLLKKAEHFKVILGGGSGCFIDKSEGGKREDGRNLLKEWNTKMKNERSHLITNFSEFKNVDPSQTDYLFGLLNKNHLDFDAMRGDQPSLSDLTEKAIRILSKNKKGFFLLVEGGRIDHGHHKSKAKLAILETLALEKAVETAIGLINFQDTLILVTADHSHVFTVGSYSGREVDITEKNQAISGEELDKKGHTSLLYSNGPGFNSPRINITDQTVFNLEYVYSSGVPLNSETHGGEDITVYGQGPWSHLLNGLHHQSYIAYVMMYASCTGKYANNCHCNKAFTFKKTDTYFLTILKLVLICFINKILE